MKTFVLVDENCEPVQWRKHVSEPIKRDDRLDECCLIEESGFSTRGSSDAIAAILNKRGIKCKPILVDEC